MSRRVRLKTVELGWIELAVIVEAKGCWPPFWEPLRGHPVASLFSSIPKEVFDHALHGWTRPLVTGLGLAPTGALHKMPDRTCALKGPCPAHDVRHCVTTSPKKPTCFEASVGVEGPVRLAATEAVRLWHEGLYLVVVVEDS